MKRLVLFVEGDGDVKAVPSLVGGLLTHLPDELQGQLFLDNAPMRVGGIHQITGTRQDNLRRHLGNANRRSALGAVLLALDGDADSVEGQPFCTAQTARTIAQRARVEGAGTLFSFAVVFLRQEYESMLLAVGNQLPGLRAGVTLPAAPEEAPRDAKGWLHDNLIGGYNPTEHQLELTRAVRDWTAVRPLRSFRRLENSLNQLATAVATGNHIVSPLPLVTPAPTTNG
jgi:hypothetical protein